MKATRPQIERLFRNYGIAVGAAGSDSRKAAQGGRVARLSIHRQDGDEMLTLAVGGHEVKSQLPHSDEDARRVVALLLAQHAISDDHSFEHMLADLLLKITKLFDECGATRLELSPLHLHATSYHIEKAALLHEKPLRITRRLEPDSHDGALTIAGDLSRHPRVYRRVEPTASHAFGIDADKRRPAVAARCGRDVAR
jgi:hypothetical protein